MTNPAAVRALSIAFVLGSIVSGTFGCGGSPDAAGNADSGDPATNDGGGTPPGRDDSGAGSDGGVPARDASGANAGDSGQGNRSDAGAAHEDAGHEDDAGAPVDDAGNGAHDAGSDAAAPAFGKVVGGYYPNWTPSPVRIKDVDPHYNVIYLFAATPASAGSGAIEWTAPGDGMGAATNLNADIAYARQTQGRKIILSIGGAGNNVSFPNRTASQTFLTSLAGIYTQLGGFDGIDWDSYEGTDAPDTTEMIWISLQLKSTYPGFLITTPPAPWSTVDQTFCAQMASAGALDYAAPQYYDGPNLATQSYIVPSVDTWAGLVGAEKLVVGFGVANAANYMTVAQVLSTWDAVIAKHPTLRGAFDWQIDVDQAAGWPFADQVGPLVNP